MIDTRERPRQLNSGGKIMKTIQIEKIKTKENIRKDYGDLTELTASIKIHGIINPVELNQSNELIDGHRRFKAAQVAGLKEIPYFCTFSQIDETTTQILAGIFQKNLNQIEEGKAFRKYMDQEKIKVEDLAKKISKKVNYIEKRLVLVKLPGEVQKALIEGKILMGHALLLARFTKQDSVKFLKKIIYEKHSVENAKESLEYSSFTVRLSEAPFDKSKCKDCPYNGSKQAELFETGKILNGNCMNPGCFQKKIKQFVKEKREEFNDILYIPENDYSTPNGYLDGSNTWECENKGIDKKYIKKCRKERDYLVQVKEKGEIIEYFRIPAKKKSKDGSKVAMKDEEVREEKREQVLTSKVSEFKTTFLINKSMELMQPGTIQTKALNFIKLIQSANYNEIENVSKELGNLIKKGYGQEVNVKNIYEAKEKDLDKAIALISKSALRRVGLKELIEISRNFKVDVKKHFEITEDYLKMYTKDQLTDLIKELKLIELEVDVKKDVLINHILGQKLKGKIPKIML